MVIALWPALLGAVAWALVVAVAVRWGTKP
jgi:hypothetical protein